MSAAESFAMSLTDHAVPTTQTRSEHVLDQATRLEPLQDGRFEGATHPAYWNFTGPFGGATAACLMQAMLMHPQRQGSPIALTVNYCAPVAEGPFQIAAEPVRTNRSSQHWSLSLSQGDQAPSTTATAVLAARPETFAHAVAQVPVLPPADQLIRFPAELAGSAWLRNYDFRFVELQPLGRRPLPGAQPTKQTFLVSDNPARPLDFVSLAAMADCFFARIFVVRGALVPAGTVSMSAYFHATDEDLARNGTAPLIATADTRVFDRGYHDQSAELWSQDGQLLVSTHQIVYYRDPKD